MLKIGTNNFIASAVLTGGNTNASFPESNAQEASLQRWQSSSSTDTLTITFSTRTVSHIAIFNVNIDSVTVTGKLGAGTVFSNTYTEKSGIDILNMYFPESGSINSLELAITNTSTVPFIGYIWLGDEETFEVEDYQPFDNSSDAAQVTRGNIAEQNPGFGFREYNITLSNNQYNLSEMRKALRGILSEYAKPRSYIISEDCSPEDVLLGILDSGRVGYDFTNIKDETGQKKVAVTIGIQEVFGGNSR